MTKHRRTRLGRQEQPGIQIRGVEAKLSERVFVARQSAGGCPPMCYLPIYQRVTIR